MVRRCSRDRRAEDRRVRHAGAQSEVLAIVRRGLLHRREYLRKVRNGSETARPGPRAMLERCRRRTGDDGDVRGHRRRAFATVRLLVQGCQAQVQGRQGPFNVVVLSATRYDGCEPVHRQGRQASLQGQFRADQSHGERDSPCGGGIGGHRLRSHSRDISRQDGIRPRLGLAFSPDV